MAGEWKEVKASEFCNSVRDGTHDSPKPAALGRRLVTSRHIIGGRLDLENAYLISQLDFDAINKRSKVDRWDVLISMIGTVGEPCLVSHEPDFAIKNIGLFKSRGEIEGKWLYYYLRSPCTQQLIRETSRGTTQQYIPLGALRELPVTVPSDRAEMGAIAHILGTLDDKIELNRRRNQTLEAMARALFKDWFVDFGPVRAKMEARDPYLPADLWQRFPERLDDEGKPEGWAYLPVGEFAELKGGKQLGKEKIAPSGPIPVFGGAGVMGYTDSHNADGFVIAVGRVGAYCGQFFSHRGKAWINNNASLIRQTDDDLAEWLFLSLSHADIDVLKKGAAQPFVSNGDIAKLPLMWPTEALIHAFTDIVGPVQKKKDQHDVESRALAQLRDTLLPKLISGELRIADAEKFLEGVGL